MAAAPLDGIRVVDFTEGDGAPFCGMQLGDAGADVIKVEPVGGDWARVLGPPFDHGDGPLLMGMNRNKRSIAVDYSSREARRIFQLLAGWADVLIEAWPGERDAISLGLDYDSLQTQNPGLIYCRISYLDEQGPDANLPATDLIVQGRAGLARFVGHRGGEPLRFGTNYAGITASMYAMQAILAALYERRSSGLGQRVSTSYLRAMVATQQNYVTSSSDPDEEMGFAVSHLGEPSRGWETMDGAIDFSIGRLRDLESIAKFLTAIGLSQAAFEHLEGNGSSWPPANLMAIRPAIEDALQKCRRADVLDVLDGLNVMCAPLHDYQSMFSDPGVLEQGVIEHASHKTRGTISTTGLPWKLSLNPGSVRLAPPMLAEHTTEILKELGLETEEISALIGSGAVYQR